MKPASGGSTSTLETVFIHRVVLETFPTSFRRKRLCRNLGNVIPDERSEIRNDA